MLTVNCNANLRARLAELDATISEHRLRIRELEDIRKVVRQELDRVVYPVLTLPPEITSEIFRQCLPPLERPYASSLDVKEAPLLLLQVCATWRSLAMSTPCLWARLLYPPILKGLEAVARVEDWFSRAGSCPLSLIIFYFENATGPDAISAILRRHAPRLQRLELVLYQHQFSRLEDMGPFPLLEELRISLPYNSIRDGAGPVLRPRIFDHTPRLKHLILGENASPSKFRLSYLSKFTCDRLAADEFFDLLRDAPFLEDCDCQVYVLPSIMSSTTGTQVVTHARLRTIRFRHSSTQILRLLRLPALENLDFQSRHEFTESHVDYLIPFLACSSASLRRFCIDTGSDPDPRVEWFSSLPGLTHVMVHNAGKEFSSAFFSKLDRAQDIGFLPRLQSLVFEDFTPDVDSSILQALSSRCSSLRDEEANLQKLRTFRLLVPTTSPSVRLEESTAATLRGFVGQGMEIHVGPLGNNLI